MKNMNKPKKISEKVIFENPWRKVLLKEVKNKLWVSSIYPSTTHSWEKFATMIIPITKNKEIVYCKEWRIWIEDFVYNFPFGIKEKGISFEDNAKKEMKEETWCVSNNIFYLWESIFANYDDTIVKYFVALDCEIWENNLGDFEFLEVMKSNKELFEENIKSWLINCPVTISCYTLAKLNLFL